MNEMALYFSGAISMFLLSSWMKKKDTVSVPVAPEQEGDINFDDLTEKISLLSDQKDRLYEVENMITEIETAEHRERGIALNLSMPTADSKYNFLVNNQSEAVLDLLYEERQKLRSSIVNELSKITIRSTKNVRKTFPESTEIVKRGVSCND